VETAGVLASIVTTPQGDPRVLGRRIHWLRQSAYIRHGGGHLSIASERHVPYLAEGEEMKAAALIPSEIFCRYAVGAKNWSRAG
jgi:hypothetical protein